MSKLLDHLNEKHVFQNITFPPSELQGIYAPAHIYSNLNGDHNIMLTWLAITEPFLMETEPVWHDFDQMCYFAGGDSAHMDELGGVAEFHLGDENGNMEKFIITKPTVIYIKAGMVHCPLNFLEIFDPKKPILFQDLTFAGVYRRYRPGSNQPLDGKFRPIEKTW